MTDVFISYKRRKRPEVEHLAAALRALKLTVWFDARLEPGNSFSAEISREVRAAKCVLICWTNDCFPHGGDENGWVLGEATIGRERGVAVPVLLEPTTLDPPWNTIHTESLVGWARADGLGEIDAQSWRDVLTAIGRKVGRLGLADYVRAVKVGTAAALKAWAQAHPDDPLADNVWSRVEMLEADALKARLAQERATRVSEQPASPASPYRSGAAQIVQRPRLPRSRLLDMWPLVPIAIGLAILTLWFFGAFPQATEVRRIPDLRWDSSKNPVASEAHKETSVSPAASPKTHTLPAQYQAPEPTLVRVFVTDAGGERSFTGVVVGDGAVVTSAVALGASTSADRVQVEPPLGDKRVATSITRAGNVVVIKVNDIRGTTPVFASEDPSNAGTWIVTWLSKSQTHSNIGVFQREPSNGIGRMEAQVQGQAFGAPLLNECNQIVGLVIPFGNNMDRIETQTRSEVLEPLVQVALASSVKAALIRNNEVVNTSPAACNSPPAAGDSASGAAGASAGAGADSPLSAEGALQKEEAENATVLDRLQDEIEELEARKETESQTYKNAQRRLREGEREKQRIADELKHAREDGDAYKSFGEEQREKNEKRQKLIFWGSIGGAVLLSLSGLIGWLLVGDARKRRR